MDHYDATSRAGGFAFQSVKFVWGIGLGTVAGWFVVNGLNDALTSSCISFGLGTEVCEY